MTELAKNWAFPKQHICVHVANDILQVGATRNGSTKPGEGMHQELHVLYLRTNFKQVEAQVSTFYALYDTGD
jgi:hypothetical protein